MPGIPCSSATVCYRSLLLLTRGTRKKAHLALHVADLAAGVYAVFKFHVESTIPNIYLLHSWLGAATISLCGYALHSWLGSISALLSISLYALQWAAGFLAFFFPGASPATRRKAEPWHAVAGLLVSALEVLGAGIGNTASRQTAVAATMSGSTRCSVGNARERTFPDLPLDVLALALTCAGKPKVDDEQ
jgi:cytochrome b-561